MIGNAATAARLTGQNVRGLTHLKLEKLVQFMKERRLLATSLMETWRVTTEGWSTEELDGYLIIHHGETAKSCTRGRNGVAIILNPEARAAWELGGSWVRHSSNGRVLTVRLPIEGGKLLTVCSACAPTSGNTSEARQAFYDDVSGQTRSENQSNVLALFMDCNASMGVGARPGTWKQGDHRALGPWGNRHVNAAGQEMREWLQIEGLAAARTFFRPKGDKHDTWWHPRSKSGYSLDHVIVRKGQIGRVKQARTCSAVAVDSDHVPTYLELRVGRMQRRQKAVGQTKPANIAALRDPEKRRAFADAVGLAITDWHSAHPTASLEERAKVFRDIPSAKALEVCGKRERREEGWFAAHREVLMELVAARNRAEAVSRRQHGQATLKRLKEARKALTRAVREAKAEEIAKMIEGCSGGQKCYWEAVRAINGGDSRTTAVAVQKFLDSEGNVCSTPTENAEAAAKHFTKVYNGARERPEGAEEAVNSVKQRRTRIDLDAPISESELDEVLRKAKPGKATSNMVAMELLQACGASPVAFGLLHNLVSEVFEDGRARPAPTPEPPPPETPPPDPDPTPELGDAPIPEDPQAKEDAWARYEAWRRGDPPPAHQPEVSREERMVHFEIDWQHGEDYLSRFLRWRGVDDRPWLVSDAATTETRDDTMSHEDRLLYLVRGAKDHGWRCQWQVENPKSGLSKDRYAGYCGAETYAEAIGLGMKSGVKRGDAYYDLDHGYLQIFPDSLRVETLVAEDAEEEDGTEPGEGPVTALLKEFASMRLKMLPKKGDLRDLNNWRGIMLLDAVSKIISMVINGRLQRLLKEVGIEEQNGFMGGRGGSDGIFCIRQALKKRREHGQESWVLFVDLVKAFDTVPRDVLFVVLAKFGVPPHLISVIKRMNTDLQVTFDLNGEPVAVPCTGGVK